MAHREAAHVAETTAGAEPPAARGTRRRTRDATWGPYGRRPVRLLALVAFIDAMDRGILPGVLTKVQDDLGFSDTQAGILGTAFVITGFLVVLPAGYLADRYRRTHIIAMVLASWGAISALNSVVRNYAQFLAVRAALGIGETIDNPASQSLLADYYPATVRGRAYGLQRLAPLLGTAAGTGLGGLVGAIFGWRWAFLLVGVPGSLLAIAVWRMPEPRRGESDPPREGSTGGVALREDGEVLGGPAPDPVPAAGAAVVGEVLDRSEHGARAMLRDVRAAASVPSLRALMIGSAITAGATTGLGFWAPTFYERHTSLGSGGSAALTAGLILIGAIGGIAAGGVITDRLRDRTEGAPMLIAGIGQFAGGALLLPTFLPTPLWFRIPGQVLAVALIVGGLPAITAMVSEVVRPGIRGASFSMVSFLSALAQAASPLLIGLIADQFSFTVDGETKGHIANAFLVTTPLVLVGSMIVLNGRRHVAADTARAAAEA